MCRRNKFKIGLCQMRVGKNQNDNIKKAISMINEASDNGANIVALGEMFICDYSNDAFRQNAQDEQSIVLKDLSKVCKEKNIYLIAGSIPEKDGDKYYNSSYVFDNNGKIIAKHRKIHLFDIDIKNKIRMMESDTFSSGDEITVFDTVYGKIGVAICYDVRFAEIFRMMADKGAKCVIIPAAFNNITGELHWNVTMRARAIDNQMYIACVSPATNDESSYLAYGHSLVSDPMGTVLIELDKNEDIAYSDIDFEYVDKVRKELPLLKHRRFDVYNKK